MMCTLTGGRKDIVASTPELSEKISDVKMDNVDQMENTVDDDEFLADDVHINGLSEEERDKMKKELGIEEMNDNVDDDLDNVEDLLADVNTDDVEELSDADLAAELDKL